jgi:hypothetical protein
MPDLKVRHVVDPMRVGACAVTSHACSIYRIVITILIGNIRLHVTLPKWSNRLRRIASWHLAQDLAVAHPRRIWQPGAQCSTPSNAGSGNWATNIWCQPEIRLNEKKGDFPYRWLEAITRCEHLQKRGYLCPLWTNSWSAAAEFARRYLPRCLSSIRCALALLFGQY